MPQWVVNGDKGHSSPIKMWTKLGVGVDGSYGGRGGKERKWVFRHWMQVWWSVEDDKARRKWGKLQTNCFVKRREGISEAKEKEGGGRDFKSLSMIVKCSKTALMTQTCMCNVDWWGSDDVRLKTKQRKVRKLYSIDLSRGGRTIVVHVCTTTN